MRNGWYAWPIQRVEFMNAPQFYLFERESDHAYQPFVNLQPKPVSKSVSIPYVVGRTIGYHSNSWASCSATYRRLSPLFTQNFVRTKPLNLRTVFVLSYVRTVWWMTSKICERRSHDCVCGFFAFAYLYIYRVVQKKRYPSFNFAITSVNVHRF